VGAALPDGADLEGPQALTISEDARRNREVWTTTNREHTGDAARRNWAAERITWGLWDVPEDDVHALPDVRGLDVVELGCGTAYFSAWLARRGARPVGVDVTPAQLETARAMQTEFGLEFPLVEASAEDVPLPDASFDLVLSEYGASIWCAPDRWIPEAARLLRPGGRLVFLCNSTLITLCSPDDGPAGELLARPQFGGLGRIEWVGDDEGVTFHVGHGELIQILRAAGFEILALHELQAPPDAVTHPYYDFVTAEWARRWPSEELWVVRRSA
jgi:SAM-dependent methyltransferase